MREETGLLIRDPRPFGFGDDTAHETIAFPNGDVCQFYVMMFYATRYKGEPTADGPESLGLSWFHPHELPPMLGNMRRSVEAYGRFAATGELQMI